MRASKNNSSKAICRGPFEPATSLEEVPIIFYEILDLATRGQSAGIAPLIRSVIEVTQRQADSLSRLPHVATNRRVITYDLETLLPIEEAGGWEAYDKLGVSILCCHDSRTGNYLVFSDHLPEPWRALYEARQLAAFNDLIAGADLLVNFDGGCATRKGFDNQVLACNGVSVPPEKCYDILVEGWRGQGIDPTSEYRSSTHGGGLNDYARANLGVEKSASGELAPVMWRQGRFREVIEYCLLDVRITAALFNLIETRGWLDNPKTGKRAQFRAPNEGKGI